MLEVEAFVQFSIANGAEVERISISLLETHGAHHEALVVDAMAKSKHVAEFMGSNLTDSH